MAPAQFDGNHAGDDAAPVFGLRRVSTQLRLFLDSCTMAHVVPNAELGQGARVEPQTAAGRSPYNLALSLLKVRSPRQDTSLHDCARMGS